MMTETLSLGARVRALRKARALTQERLAHLAGIDPNHVHRIENGTRKRIGPDVLAGLARALDVSIAELLGSEPPPLPPDPWMAALGTRLDQLPDKLRAQLRQLITELVAVIEQPLVGYAQAMANLLGETTELSDADLERVAEYALALMQRQSLGEKAADADDDESVSAG